MNGLGQSQRVSRLHEVLPTEMVTKFRKLVIVRIIADTTLQL
jgi:hypothetical protein